VILIVAMLVILALAGIGIVAAQAVSNEINLAGNARVAQVARNVASSGAEATMAFAGTNPSGFNQFVSVDRGDPRLQGVIQMADLSNAFFDTATDGTGSFGRDGVTVNTARWQSQMQSALTTHRAPGFQLGEYCFRRYISVTSGVYRNDLAGTATLVVDRNAQARSMTALFVGPVSCP
jgi:hypothetical protein